MTPVHLRVPATSANLGPGFDVLGVAVSLFSDLNWEASGGWGSRIEALDVAINGAGTDALPRDGRNLVLQSAERVFKARRRWPRRLRLEVINRIPLSRGLGSSSAAIVGGLAGANRLLGDPFSQDQLLQWAVEMEGHGDNVTPALVGGFCVTGLFGGQLRYWKFAAPRAVKAVVCVPEQPLLTRDARRVLPRKVPFKDAVTTASHTAHLIGALLEKRYDWLAEAMNDVLHQPARARLIPGLFDVIDAARRAGAYGSALSGAGSCVLALASPGAARATAQAMEAAFARHDRVSRSLILNFENKGVRFL